VTFHTTVTVCLLRESRILRATRPPSTLAQHADNHTCAAPHDRGRPARSNRSVNHFTSGFWGECLSV